MSLDQVLRREASAREVPSPRDWEAIERRLGRLPMDYKEFVNSYGTGVVDEFLWVFSPSTRNDNLSLGCQHENILADLRGTRDKYPVLYRVNVHPEVGGLFPMAGTDNGDTVYWETNGPPEAWTMAVMGPRAPEIFRFAGGFVPFLVGILGRSVRCDRFPEEFPSHVPASFRPTEGW